MAQMSGRAQTLMRREGRHESIPSEIQLPDGLCGSLHGGVCGEESKQRNLATSATASCWMILRRKQSRAKIATPVFDGESKLPLSPILAVYEL